jgi:hypothetical protein
MILGDLTLTEEALGAEYVGIVAYVSKLKCGTN